MTGRFGLLALNVSYQCGTAGSNRNPTVSNLPDRDIRLFYATAWKGPAATVHPYKPNDRFLF